MKDELKQFRNDVLERIKKQPLIKSKEYYGEPVGELVNNELIGLEYPQVIQFMEQKQWIKKVDGSWSIVLTAFGIDPNLIRFRDLRNRLISSESKIEELKQLSVDNLEISL